MRIGRLKISDVVVRLALALVALLLAAGFCYPRATAMLEEARENKAVSKSRVLMRGAQIVATQRLVAGDSWDEAEAYLCRSGSMSDILRAAAFGVEGATIDRVELNAKGIITGFDCTLEQDGRQYRVTLDLPGDKATPVLLKKLEK